jgi:hypothetical protein
MPVALVLKDVRKDHIPGGNPADDLNYSHLSSK